MYNTKIRAENKHNTCSIWCHF